MNDRKTQNAVEVLYKLPAKKRQQIVQGIYFNILEDYELDTWIPHDYKWKGILNSYVRKYPAHHVIKAIHTAEYYLQEDKYYDNKETIKVLRNETRNANASAT